MSIYSLIREDLRQPKMQDPAYRSFVELFFNYPGVWAIVNHRISNFLWKNKWHRFARILAGISNFLTRVDLHPAAKIGRRVFIDHAIGVVIGETTEIGDDCLIYQGVTLGGVSLKKGKRHPTIKEGVVIGAGAKVLGNIVIGAGAKIGANSVVVKNVEKGCSAVGIPAKAIGGCKEENRFNHSDLPDISKELFLYLVQKVEILEKEIGTDKTAHLDTNLDKLYEKYIKSIKE